MINIDKLLSSKRLEVAFAEIKVDKFFVKQFRQDNNLTQLALSNILGVTKKTIEKWEQGVNNVNGSSAVLLKLLRDNPDLLNQLYAVKKVESTHEEYQPIESKQIKVNCRTKTTPSVFWPLVAMV